MSYQAILLLILLFYGILTMWVSGMWAPGSFEIGLFLLAIPVISRFHRTAALAKAARLPLLLLSLVPVYGAFQILTGRSAYQYATRISILAWASTACAFGLAASLDERDLRRFRQALLWFSFVMAAIAAVQVFTSEGKVFWIFPTQYHDNVLGPILSRNHWAAFMELALPMAIYEVFRSRGKTLLYAAMVATLYASVIASASRAGTVLCTAALIIVPLAMIRRGVRAKEAGIMFATVALLLASFSLVVGPEVVWQRLLQPDPYAARRDFLLSSWAMFRQHPGIGFGLGTWSTVYPQFALTDTGAWANQAHNDWVQWAAEGGIPLVGMLLGVAVWAVWRGLMLPWGLGVSLVLMHAWVDYPFSRPALSAWIAVVLGLLAHPTHGMDTEDPQTRDPADELQSTLASVTTRT
jgi:O-antigen ligase